MPLIAAGPGVIVARERLPACARHADAVEISHEGIPLLIIQGQLDHASRPSHRSTCGIDDTEIVHVVHDPAPPAPTIPASHCLSIQAPASDEVDSWSIGAGWRVEVGPSLSH